VTRVRSGRPAGGRRREDVRTPATLVVALSAPRSRRGTSVQPVERTSNVRCPDGQACAVRALPPRGPRRAGPGVAGCGGRPAGRSGSRAPVSAGGWSPACIGP